MSKTTPYPCKMIAKDIPGAEGPCVNMRGEFFMVAPNLGQVLRVDESGETSIFAETGGIPAGLQCDRSNRLWLADMKLGILSISPEGTVRMEAPEFDGKPMRGCNDCAFDSMGNLYVTAPAGSGKDAPTGEVFCRRHNGELVLLDGGFQFCNGIAVSGDDRILIVAETLTRWLWAYDILAPGKVANKRQWAQLVDVEGGLGPDGLDFDSAGNLLAAYWGGGSLDVFNPEGELIERIMLPFKAPSNLHFGGRGSRTIYVTEHDSNGLWKLEWERGGQPQFCER